jgi:hypothetical protein
MVQPSPTSADLHSYSIRGLLPIRFLLETMTFSREELWLPDLAAEVA